MNSKNELVVKSNRLIEASYRLTLAEQRIILFAIVEARRTQKGLSADTFIDILAADYAAMFDIPVKQAYEQIKEAAQTLFYREFILYDTRPETGNERMTKGRWVSAASYIDGDGVIQLQFSGVIVPYITKLEAEFTRYKLEKIAHMSSAYAIRLYELLMQWGSVGRREVELEWLKKILMVDKNYERLDNFKKWVVDVAVAQINAHSDLTASYTQRKTGRVVTHLIFTFALKEEAAQEKAPAKAKETHAEIRASDLFKRLRSHGIGDRLAVAWILKDEARARATVEYVEARAKRGMVKGSTAGYLRTLFEDGAEVGKSTFEAELEAQARETEAQARNAADMAKRAEAEKRAKAKADREAKDLAKAAVLALAPEARRALADEYREGATVRSAWDEKKSGFRDSMENIAFNLWLQTRVSAQNKPEATEPEPSQQELAPKKGALYEKMFGRGKTND
jgi:plasmid replication initiation protein